MGEIYVDGQLVTGAFIDGIEVDEIWIDGCVIAFEQLIRTGWQTVSGGSGTASINLSEANQVLQSGIRFRGTSSSSTDVSRDSGYNAVCTTSGSSACGGYTSVITSPGTAPFGCQYGSMSGVTAYTRAQLFSQNSPTPQAAVWVEGEGPAIGYPPLTSLPLSLSPRSSVHHSGQSLTESNGVYDRFVISGRTVSIFPRVCNSAMNNRDVSFPGPWTGTYSFWLSQGSLAPSSSGTQIDHKDDDTGDWFYAVPFPDSAFIAGQNNTVTLHNIDGSGSVQVELFAVYR